MIRTCDSATPDFVEHNVRRLEECRAHLGMSQRDFADRVGIAQMLVCAYECGIHMPRKKNYNKLARYFCWEVWE